MCACEINSSPEAVCDQACRDTAEKVAMVLGSDGLTTYVVTTKADGTSSNISTTGIAGMAEASSKGGTGSLNPVKFGGDDGIAGVYLKNGTATSDYMAALLSPNTNSDGTRRSKQRRVATTSPSSTIANPLICLELAEGILFDVSASSTSYPVYDKDSLLNSNPSFDFGAFQSMAQSVANAGATVFAFTFVSAGTYAFYDNSNPNIRMVVTVKEAGAVCASDAKIQPVTAANLVAMGISKTDDITTEPDWLLLGGVVGGLFTAVLLLIGLVTALQSRGWGLNKAVEPRYRELGSELDMDQFAQRGTHDIVDEKGSINYRGGKDPTEDDEWHRNEKLTLEGFSVHTLYDKLEDQTIHVNSHLQAHERGFLHHYDKLGKATEQLKALLVAMIERSLGDEEKEGFREMLAQMDDPDAITAGNDEPTVADGNDMLSMFQKFAEKAPETNPEGSEYDPTTAKLLAGMLGMALGAKFDGSGGLMLQDGNAEGGGFGGEGFGGDMFGGGNQDGGAGGYSAMPETARSPHAEAGGKAAGIAVSNALADVDGDAFELLNAQREQLNAALASGDLNDDEIKKLMDEMEEQSKKLISGMDSEYNRQQNALKDRLAKRKKGKDDDLDKKQIMEKAEQKVWTNSEAELVAAKDEMDEQTDKLAEMCEIAAVQMLGNAQTLMTNPPADDHDQAARDALNAYKKGLNSLEDDLKAKNDEAKRKMQARLAARNAKKRAEQDARHDAEKVAAGDDPAAVAELEEKHKVEDEQLEATLAEDTSALEQQAAASDQAAVEMVDNAKQLLDNADKGQDASDVLNEYQKGLNSLDDAHKREMENQRKKMQDRLKERNAKKRGEQDTRHKAEKAAVAGDAKAVEELEKKHKAEDLTLEAELTEDLMALEELAEGTEQAADEMIGLKLLETPTADHGQGARDALDAYKQSADTLETDLKRDMDRQKQRMQDKLAARNAKRRSDQQDQHSAERADIGDDDLAAVEQLNLRHKAEDELLETELAGAQTALEDECLAADMMLAKAVNETQALQELLADIPPGQDATAAIEAFRDARDSLETQLRDQRDAQKALIARRLEAQKSNRVEAREQLQCEMVKQLEKSQADVQEMVAEGEALNDEVLASVEKILQDKFGQLQSSTDSVLEQCKLSVLADASTPLSIDEEVGKLQKQYSDSVPGMRQAATNMRTEMYSARQAALHNTHKANLQSAPDQATELESRFSAVTHDLSNHADRAENIVNDAVHSFEQSLDSMAERSRQTLQSLQALQGMVAEKQIDPSEILEQYSKAQADLAKNTQETFDKKKESLKAQLEARRARRKDTLKDKQNKEMSDSLNTRPSELTAEELDAKHKQEQATAQQHAEIAALEDAKVMSELQNKVVSEEQRIKDLVMNEMKDMRDTLLAAQQMPNTERDALIRANQLEMELMRKQFDDDKRSQQEAFDKQLADQLAQQKKENNAKMAELQKLQEKSQGEASKHFIAAEGPVRTRR